MATSKVAKGGLWALAGLATGAVLQFGYNIGVARAFGASGTGTFAFALGLTSVAAVVAQLGAKETLVRFIADYSTRKAPELQGLLRVTFGLAAIGGLVASGLLFFFSPILARLSTGQTSVDALRWMALTVLPVTMMHTVAAAFQGIGRLDTFALLRQVGRNLAITIAVTLSIMLGFALTTFTAIYLAVVVLFAIASLYLLLRRFSPQQGTARFLPAKAWLTFSLTVFFLHTFRSTTGWLDTVLLGFLLPSADVGHYFVALRTALLVSLPLAAVNAALTPVIAELWSRQESQHLRTTFQAATRWTAASALWAGITIAIVHQDVLAFFGPEFSVPSMSLIILPILGGRIINGLTGGVARFLLMTDQERIELWDTIASMILLGLGTWIGVKLYGLRGAAFANGTVVGLMNVVRLFQAWKTTGIHPYNLGYLKLIPASAIALIGGLAARMYFPDTLLAVKVLAVGALTFALFLGAMLFQGLDTVDLRLAGRVRTRISKASRLSRS